MCPVLSDSACQRTHWLPDSYPTIRGGYPPLLSIHSIVQHHRFYHFRTSHCVCCASTLPHGSTPCVTDLTTHTRTYPLHSSVPIVSAKTSSCNVTLSFFRGWQCCALGPSLAVALLLLACRPWCRPRAGPSLARCSSSLCMVQDDGELTNDAPEGPWPASPLQRRRPPRPAPPATGHRVLHRATELHHRGGRRARRGSNSSSGATGGSRAMGAGRRQRSLAAAEDSAQASLSAA